MFSEALSDLAERYSQKLKLQPLDVYDALRVVWNSENSCNVTPLTPPVSGERERGKVERRKREGGRRGRERGRRERGGGREGGEEREGRREREREEGGPGVVGTCPQK